MGYKAVHQLEGTPKGGRCQGGACDSCEYCDNTQVGRTPTEPAMDWPLGDFGPFRGRSVFDSVSINALSSALEGLSARQNAIANNIANVNTPGYKARVVSFESQLAASVASGDGTATPVTTLSTADSNVNGNNVDVSQETVDNVNTVLRYQLASRAVAADFTATQTALQTS